MPSQIVSVTNEKQWPNTSPSFLQSWAYGDFLKLLGREVERWVWTDSSGKTYGVQCILLKGKFGICTAYAAHAMVPDACWKALVEAYREKGVTAVRIEAAEASAWAHEQGRLVKNRQPQWTWLLDITQDEEELLSGMHSKTRYNIRLSERKGVTVKEEKNIDTFWALHEATAKRNHFVPHPYGYCQQLLEYAHTRQFTAWKGDTALASAIILHHEGSAIYLLGSSSHEQRKLMAPYAMHWEIIRALKKEDVSVYDWWGIAAPAQEGDKAKNHHAYTWKADHPLSGVTRFKVGFGGAVKAYPEAVDVVCNPLKWHLDRMIKKVRGSVIVGHPE